MSQKKQKEYRQAQRKENVARYNVYRNAGEGCCLWAEENVWVPIYPEGSDIAVWTPIYKLSKEPHPETGRSYWSMWENQKRILCEALRMENGRFVHRLIVFCWMRGEGKSFMANLIQMWKFFCWPKQNIVLCSNSKEQSSFLQYDEIKSMINHSPKLLKIVGKKNLQEKEIRRKDRSGNIVSKIQSISSFSGIVSNITGYAFSEFFECKRQGFFSKVDGSIRNVPNAIGVIDSTVSSKVHVLYQLNQAFKNNKDPLLYFSYRCSKDGNYKDFWHPNNTQAQLNSYRVTMPLGDFARFFQNLWSAGAEKIFSQEEIEAINYIGADQSANCHQRVIDLVRRKFEIIESDKRLIETGVDVWKQDNEIKNVEKHLWPVSDIYRIQTESGLPTIADVSCLEKLSGIYDTDWAISGGLDRADPLKRRTAARSIFTLIAKGLPGSRSNPDIGKIESQKKSKGLSKKNHVKPELEVSTLRYIYFLLYVGDIMDHSLEEFKKSILLGREEFDGIDIICSERYGAWDMVPWGENFDIKFELFHPTYAIQLAMFTYFYNLVNSGRFKAPPSAVPGSKLDDIVKEEMMYFDHDDETKWFGSPEKALKRGVQDDCMFALANAIYGARFLNVDDFRPRQGNFYFGTMIQPTGLKGRWL